MTNSEQVAIQHEPVHEGPTWAQIPPVLRGCVIQSLAEYSARLKREHCEKSLAFSTVIDGVEASRQDLIKRQIEASMVLAPYQATIAAVECAMSHLDAKPKAVDTTGESEELNSLLEEAARVLVRTAETSEDHDLVKRLRTFTRSR